MAHAGVVELLGRGEPEAGLAEVLLPAVRGELPAGDGEPGAVGKGDVVAARSVVTRGASAAAQRVGDGEGEHPARREALGDGREQQLGGCETDGAEDGVDRVELLVGGVQVVQGVAGDEGEIVQPSVVGAGAADLEADQVDAGDVGAVAGGEVGGVVAGAAAEFQESLGRGRARGMPGRARQISRRWRTSVRWRRTALM